MKRPSSLPASSIGSRVPDQTAVFTPLLGILWDNDGVLVDTERIYFEVNRDFLRGHAVELTEQNYFDWFLCDRCGAWHLLEGRGLSQSDIEALRQQRNELYRARLEAATDLALAEMAEILGRLAGRVRMGIVTSSRRDHFDAIHRGLGLLPHFEFALTAETYSQSKPSPEPYLLGLRRLGLPADSCVVVEDSPRGLESASAAGLRCIILRTPMNRRHAFTGAHRVVNSPAELLAELLALVGD